ncbi:MAG: hypothetical protein R3C03_02085 [Pirellulaceae bacterium]
MVLFCFCTRLICAQEWTLENEYLCISIASDDGRILQIENRFTSQRLISDTPSQPPIAVLLNEPLQLSSDIKAFSLKKIGENNIELRWSTIESIEIVATVFLDGDRVSFVSNATNSGLRTLLGFRYPVIDGTKTLGVDGQDDRLLHSAMMGVVFKNPSELFVGDSQNPLERGLVVSRYPNGFHGSATQLFAFYEQNVGGFYFACEDAKATDKDLNFFETPNRTLALDRTAGFEI